MKRILIFLFILTLSGLVVAQGSEFAVNLNIGDGDDGGQDYVSSTSFWNVYGAYVFGLIILLIIVILLKKGKRRVGVVKKVKGVKGKRKSKGKKK